MAIICNVTLSRTLFHSKNQHSESIPKTESWSFTGWIGSQASKKNDPLAAGPVELQIVLDGSSGNSSKRNVLYLCFSPSQSS